MQVLFGLHATRTPAGPPARPPLDFTKWRGTSSFEGPPCPAPAGRLAAQALGRKGAAGARESRQTQVTEPHMDRKLKTLENLSIKQ